MIDIAQIEPVVASMHGDQRDLVELLRSGKPLCQSVREYLADELERLPPDRFRQRTKVNRDVAREDYRIHVLVREAKWMLNVGAGASLDAHVSDRAALDWLAEQGIEIESERLNNAKRRRRAAGK
ncbi:hypothetical protein H9L13_06780 [Sphingomonas lutea]|uniref:Uncharacterized protein n=1 Tax=Sphingomonas lutea TaxID=1045317 RepID=A0A7G9SF11_9SPHN|nr:hypothetical protein [Sphingomonas lutea]QNN66436.1 hypothetical protein H9L13_06780 [Sphingomonas lutea]